MYETMDSFNHSANRFSFIEENHEYKRRSQARQSQQVPQPGRPSQDMMSFWG
jgi:RAT1-interacting protein